MIDHGDDSLNTSVATPHPWNRAGIAAAHRAWIADPGSQGNKQGASDKEKAIWDQIFDAQENGEPLDQLDLSLDLAELGLTDVSPTLWDLGVTLKFLDLSNNQLREVPESVEKLVGLQMFLLSHNILTTLPTGLGRLRELRRLDVSHNQINTVPENVFEPFTTTAFDPGHVVIGSTGMSRHRVGMGKILDLSSNELTTLPSGMANVQDNNKVHIVDNFITTLPDNFASWNIFELELSVVNLIPEHLEMLRTLGSGPRVNVEELTQVEEEDAQHDPWGVDGLNLTGSHFDAPDLDWGLIPESGGDFWAALVLNAEEDADRARQLESAAERWLPDNLRKKQEMLAALKTIRETCETAADTGSGADRHRMNEFSRMLDRLTETADYKNGDARHIVEAQVVEVLTAVTESEFARGMLFDAAVATLGTCGDRVADGWSSEVLRALDCYIAIRDDWSEQDRLRHIKGEWLTRQIEIKVHELSQTADDMDAINKAVGYKIKLAEQLNLPHVPQAVLYGLSSTVNDAELLRMRDHLDRLDQHLLHDFTANHPVWQDWQKQHRGESMDAIAQNFQAAMSALEKPWTFQAEKAPKIDIPPLQLLADNTKGEFEWAGHTLIEIAQAKAFALRQFTLLTARTAWLSEMAGREADTPSGTRASASASALPPFAPTLNPDDGLNAEAQTRRTARLDCLTEFAHAQIRQAAAIADEKAHWRQQQTAMVAWLVSKQQAMPQEHQAELLRGLQVATGDLQRGLARVDELTKLLPAAAAQLRDRLLVDETTLQGWRSEAAKLVLDGPTLVDRKTNLAQLMRRQQEMPALMTQLHELARLSRLSDRLQIESQITYLLPNANLTNRPFTAVNHSNSLNKARTDIDALANELLASGGMMDREIIGRLSQIRTHLQRLERFLIGQQLAVKRSCAELKAQGNQLFALGDSGAKTIKDVEIIKKVGVYLFVQLPGPNRIAFGPSMLFTNGRQEGTVSYDYRQITNGETNMRQSRNGPAHGH